MSILYFQIVNLNDKKIIGTYYQSEINSSSIKEDFEARSTQLANRLSTENGIGKEIINFKTYKDKKIDLYYSITSNSTLYIAFVEILSFYFDNFKENSIYELFEEIDGQGIKKNIDKNGKLTMVAQQNLKFSIEKYQNTYFNNSGGAGGLIEDDPHGNKIAIINEHINDVKNDMAANVKNMMNNVQDMNEMEGKAVSIKDASFQFRRNSKALEYKMKKNVIRNRIILIVSITLALGLIAYLIFK